MEIVISKRLTLLGLIWLLAAAGCESGSGPLAPVRGKVAYQGVPLHTGVIVFTPDPLRGTSGPVARAEIQPDGSYTLLTENLAGTAAGWHRVTIVAVEAPAGVPEGQFVVP